MVYWDMISLPTEATRYMKTLILLLILIKAVQINSLPFLINTSWSFGLPWPLTQVVRFMVLHFLKRQTVGTISKTIIHFACVEVLVWGCDSFYLCSVCLALIMVSVLIALAPMSSSKMHHVLPLCSAMNQNRSTSNDKRPCSHFIQFYSL